LGTLAVIVGLTVLGLWWAKMERRREARLAALSGPEQEAAT
jgi:hypothetical protein